MFHATCTPQYEAHNSITSIYCIIIMTIDFLGYAQVADVPAMGWTVILQFMHAAVRSTISGAIEKMHDCA